MGGTLFIVNPTGQGGAGARVWRRLERGWPDLVGAGDVRFTESQGHAREIAAGAGDYDIVTAVGGDGTVGEVLSGVMDRPEPRPRLAVVPAGTGNDIARYVGVPSIETAASALREGGNRSYDVIRVECAVAAGPGHRYAFLFGNVGFSAAPVIRPWMKRYLGARGAYYLAVITAAALYRPPRMTVRSDGREHRGPTWLVIVANADRAGGDTMCIAPGAAPDDGKLSVAIIPARSKAYMFTRLLPGIADGSYVHDPSVSYFSAGRVRVEADRPAHVDIDGDLFGSTPATLSICPRALRVLVPPAITPSLPAAQ